MEQTVTKKKQAKVQKKYKSTKNWNDQRVFILGDSILKYSNSNEI